MQKHTPQKYRAANHFHIIYMKFKYYFSVIIDYGSINTAWKMQLKLSSGVTSSSCLQEYVLTNKGYQY